MPETQPISVVPFANLLHPLPHRRVYPWHHLYWALDQWQFNCLRKGKVAKLRHAIYRYEAQRYFQHPPRAAVLEGTGKSISTGAGLLDYFFLHRYITSRKPKRVLELGSGVTSVIIAEALAENLDEDPDAEPGHLHTMEDIEKYYLDARELCPKPLRQLASYHLSPQKEKVWRGGLLINCYEFLPEEEFDFIFVDGPNPQNGSQAINGDALQILSRQTERRCDVALDGRRPTLYAFRRMFRGGCMARDGALNVGFAKNVRADSLRTAPGKPQKLRDVNVFAHLKI